MGVVGRLDQYASTLAWEFDETTANNPSITGLGTYYASDFNENVGDGPIVTSGLVLNLDAGNPASYPGSGSTWTNLVDGGNNATLVGPTYSSTNGGSLVFNGTNNYAIISTFTNTPASTLTLLYWIKYTQQGWIVQQNRSSGNINNQFIFQITGGKLNFWDYSTSFGFSSNPLLNQSNTTLSPNIWYQVAFVKNGTSGTYYLNGVQDGTSTAALNVTYGNSNHAIGFDLRDNNSYFGGNIAVASIYNTALTAAEVSQNYNALAGRYGLSTLSSTFTIPAMTANVFAPYDLVYDDFGGTLFGAGQGRYMKQNANKSVIVYNEIDEVTDFYGRGIVRDGLVLDLDAGNTTSYVGSGTTWTDLSVYGNNGTLVNGPTYSSANGGSIVFNGSNNYVDVTSNLGVLSGYTICHWSRRDAENRMPIGTRTGSSFYQFGDNSWAYTHGGVAGEYYYPKSVSIPTGTWGFYCITYDGSAVRIYRNSVLEGSQSTTGTANWTNGIRIGFWAGGPGYYYQGPIANVSMYSRALSAGEISQNYNALRNRYGL